MVGCTAAEGLVVTWLSSPLSPSSGSGMYSMQSTGAANGKDLTVRGEGRFKEKISTWPPAPSCPPPTCSRDPERPSGTTTRVGTELGACLPGDLSQTSTHTEVGHQEEHPLSCPHTSRCP